MLPKSGGTYQAEFISEPALARWRRDGDGRWRLFFFTSHKGWATAEIRKDEEAPSQAKDAASRPPGNAPLRSAPAVATAGARVASGTEPPAYSTQFGERSESCFHCHGRRPTVSEDGDRGRIIASGAAANNASALRRAMVTPRAGGIMDRVLADPSLTDDQLDTIRLWLRAMRDGHAERQSDRVLIHNLRSPRDAPARLALVRADGKWQLPSGAGCRQGTTVKGGEHCEIRLPAGNRGTLTFRFAPSDGLQPQDVTLQLGGP
jgi:hypothetical protein